MEKSNSRDRVKIGFLSLSLRGSKSGNHRL
nr:MAG TPA: hypothetical protein [Caudoviricetes sp.]